MAASPSPAENSSFAIVVSEKGGGERREVFERSEISVGRVQGNDLMLPKGNVSKRHARLLYRDNRFIVTDLNSTNGTYVNRRRISQATIVRQGDRVYIGDFVLRIELADEASAGESGAAPAQAASDSDHAPSAAAPRLEPDAPPSPRVPAQPSQISAQPSQISTPGVSPKETSSPNAGSAPRTQALDAFPPPGPAVPVPAAPMPSAPRVPPPPATPATPGSGRGSDRDMASTADRSSGALSGSREATLAPEVLALREALLRTVTAVESQLGAALESEIDPALGRQIDQAIAERVELLGQQGQLPQSVDPARLREVAGLELAGLGPIGALLADDAVTEIAVPHPSNVLATRGGLRAPVEPPFSTSDSLRRAVVRLCRLAGRAPEQGETVVERRLPAGAWLSAVTGDLVGSGPMLLLHKPERQTVGIEDLVRRGSVSRAIATFLSHCVTARASVLVIGDRDARTGDILNAAAGLTDGQLVVVQTEDELVSGDQRVTRLPIRPEMGDPGGLLRMASQIPDAWLVCENLEGPLAAAALDAAGSGMDGLLAGLRAPTLARGVIRLVRDLMGAARCDRETALMTLAANIQVIVEVSRLRDGRQRVLRVTEVLGVKEKELDLQNIFSFHVERTAAGGSVEGTFVPSGVVPRLAQDLASRGIVVETSLFSRPPSR